MKKQIWRGSEKTNPTKTLHAKSENKTVLWSRCRSPPRRPNGWRRPAGRRTIKLATQYGSGCLPTVYLWIWIGSQVRKQSELGSEVWKQSESGIWMWILDMKCESCRSSEAETASQVTFSLAYAALDKHILFTRSGRTSNRHMCRLKHCNHM